MNKEEEQKKTQWVNKYKIHEQRKKHEWINIKYTNKEKKNTMSE